MKKSDFKTKHNPVLIVTEFGDESVGISPQSWEIQAPIYISDMNNIDKHDADNLDRFKHDILNLYKDYCEFGISADYIHDLNNQID